MNQPMLNLLAQAYQKPDRQFCFYASADSWDGAGLASEKLKRLPGWEWKPVKEGTYQGGGTAMTPITFGCEPFETPEGRLWCKKMIHDIGQIKDIAVPDIYTGQTGRVLKSLQETMRTLPENAFVHMCDIQSPLGCAEVMWDDSFYTALIEYPQAIHKLLDKIDLFLSRFIKELHRVAQGRMIPSVCPPVWAPPGKGYYISDDTMSLISPAMHREFGVTYLNRITEACGPLYYHSCTWRAKYFNNIHQLNNVALLNWNAGNSDDPKTIIAEFSGKAILAPHIVIDMHRDNDVLQWNPNFQDEAEFLKYFLDNLRGNSCMYFWFSNLIQKGAIMEQIYNLLHERGYSPQAKGVA